MFKRIVRWFKARFCINHEMHEAASDWLKRMEESTRKEVDIDYRKPTVPNSTLICCETVAELKKVGIHQYKVNFSNGVISVAIGDKKYLYLPAAQKVKHKQRSMSCTPQQFARSMRAKKVIEFEVERRRTAEKQRSEMSKFRGRNLNNLRIGMRHCGLGETTIDKVVDAASILNMAGASYWCDYHNGTLLVTSKNGIRTKFYPTKNRYHRVDCKARVISGSVHNFIKYLNWLEANSAKLEIS